MRIAISGASGLVGSALCAHLRSTGHQVIALVRHEAGVDELRWSVARQQIDAQALEGLDAVVHLAGAPIAGARWTAARKELILSSRTAGTTLLCEALASLKRPPPVLVSASAVGFYGDGRDAILDESGPAGDNFLAQVCRGWEDATAPATRAGIRVVNLRIGVVIAGSGGALPEMLPAFKLGLGGPIAGGRQWMSWIALTDLVRAIQHCVATPALSGPVLGVAPDPVRQGDFARALGQALGRPAFIPTPGFALRLGLGEMAQLLLFEGQRCTPRALSGAGFEWWYPALDQALAYALDS